MILLRSKRYELRGVSEAPDIPTVEVSHSGLSCNLPPGCICYRFWPTASLSLFLHLNNSPPLMALVLFGPIFKADLSHTQRRRRCINRSTQTCKLLFRQCMNINASLIHQNRHTVQSL
uniref:Uncharacterized protein n=1 Tax=Salarias fasciatus TaxID=181472 RepID=A0A672H3N7_SALFA